MPPKNGGKMKPLRLTINKRFKWLAVDGDGEIWLIPGDKEPKFGADCTWRNMNVRRLLDIRDLLECNFVFQKSSLYRLENGVVEHVRTENRTMPGPTIDEDLFDDEPPEKEA